MDELLNNAPCGFLVFTDDGQIVEANQTLLDLLAFERDELSKLHIEKIFPVAGRIFYQTHFFPLLKLRGEVEEIYLSLIARHGDEIPVLVNAARRERDGTFFNDCIFVAMRRRNQYEDEILKAKKEAEAATRAKDEFLLIVSHDLRTPLNAILGWAQILRNKQPDAETVKHAIETIGRSAEAQKKLIEDILDFARIISGKLRIEVGRVDLARVIENAVAVVTPAAVAKEIRLQTILDSNGFASGDATRLQQVLWNLFSNAIKFTPKGGRVLVRLERVNSNMEISISDTGKGIRAEFLPYVFERFRQADNSTTQRSSGLGLGLAITRHIVELHGGMIRAESPGENLGATFTVSLPVMSVHQKDAPAIPQSFSSIDDDNPSFADAPRLDGLHILIVDDEADARELLTIIISRQGAQVTASESVAEAVEKFRLTKPDLIISDIEMPGGDGFVLIEKLHAFNKNLKQKIPAIALTGHVRQADRLKVLSAGFQTYLAKPVEPVELLTVIANLVKWNKR